MLLRSVTHRRSIHPHANTFRPFCQANARYACLPGRRNHTTDAQDSPQYETTGDLEWKRGSLHGHVDDVPSGVSKGKLDDSIRPAQYRSIRTQAPEINPPEMSKDAALEGSARDDGVVQGVSGQERGVQSQGQTESAELKDEMYVRRELYVPTAEDYPDLRAVVFERPQVALANVAGRLSSVTQDHHDLGNGLFRCSLTYQSPKHEERTVGNGVSKSSASVSAHLQLLARFHQMGIFREIFDPRRQQDNDISIPDGEEHHAIRDVYNYAAKFDLAPSYEVQRLKQGPKEGHLQVDLKLPEQNIHSQGISQSLKFAEILAALSFKAKAEEHQRSNKENTLIIKGLPSLTIETAKEFLKFYDMEHPEDPVKFEVIGHQLIEDLRTYQSTCQASVHDKPITPPLAFSTKRLAEDVARLQAATFFKKRHPTLFPQYVKALEAGYGEIAKPLEPVSLFIDDDCTQVMQQTLLVARSAGLPDVIEADQLKSDVQSSRADLNWYCSRPNQEMVDEMSLELQRLLSELREDHGAQKARNARSRLPIIQSAQQVLDLVNNNQYSVIVGATGSGKSTQVPQILLERAIDEGQGALCNILCTQPRRIAAASVAMRVAFERGEPLRQSVGFHVRGKRKLPLPAGSISYYTTGVLMKQLQIIPDEVLEFASHLIIDEIHQRDISCDFLLVLLRKHISRRKAEGKSVPKVILMSATVETDLFANYFKSRTLSEESLACSVLRVPGRLFPVEEKYLDEILGDLQTQGTSDMAIENDRKSKDFIQIEKDFKNQHADIEGVVDDTAETSVIDWKRERNLSTSSNHSVTNIEGDEPVPFGLLATVIIHIAQTTKDGAILVFLPGLEEILKVEEILLNETSFGVDFSDVFQYKIYKLHSMLPLGQKGVFSEVAPGCRKIVLSTNVAESSITIPDVRYVVDAGKLREKQYDHNRRVESLVCTWITQTNLKQRAGRAGRVQDGNYYGLYSKERRDSLRPIPVPEIQRSDLQSLCLNIRASSLNDPIHDLLAETIEPPDPRMVDASVRNLKGVGALTHDENLTPLGQVLAHLPVHPPMGKMILLGVIFRCLDPMILLGSTSRSLFLAPPGFRSAMARSKSRFVDGSGSDQMASLNAIRELRRLIETQNYASASEFTARNFIHMPTFKQIMFTADQIEESLVNESIIPNTRPEDRQSFQYGSPYLNENSHRVPLIRALLLTGGYTNLAVCVGSHHFRTAGKRAVQMHPRSVNAKDMNNENDGSARGRMIRHDEGQLFTYATLANSNDGKQTFLRDTTEVSPLIVALFGNKVRPVKGAPNTVCVDDWITLRTRDQRKMQMLMEFRKALQRLLVGAFRELGGLPARTGLPEDGKYWADDHVREIFASGIVEVLDRDIRV